MIRDLQNDIEEIKRFSQKDKYRDKDLEDEIQTLKRDINVMQEQMDKILRLLESIAPGNKY